MFPSQRYTSRSGLRVWVSRDEAGIIRRYGDPDSGKTLTRNEGIRRMSFNQTTGQVEDSLGNQIRLGELSLRAMHETEGLINVRQTTSPLKTNPWTYATKKNEEIIERLIVIGKDGKINKIDISHGQGKMYDPSAKGKVWRADISNALGLDKDDRLTTDDLEKMVVHKQIVVRRTYSR